MLSMLTFILRVLKRAIWNGWIFFLENAMEYLSLYISLMQWNFSVCKFWKMQWNIYLFKFLEKHWNSTCADKHMAVCLTATSTQSRRVRNTLLTKSERSSAFRMSSLMYISCTKCLMTSKRMC